MIDFDDLMSVPLDSYEPYKDYYIGEMATVATDESSGFRIQVNPDPNRIGVPYFKVYNSLRPKEKETKVARLHFLDSGIEHHRDGYIDWNLTNKEIKMIKEVLLSPYQKKDPDVSIWDMCKWFWNLEYREFYNDKIIHAGDIDDYLDGKYDDIPEFYMHPSYVPSTTEIPDTWK